MKKLKTYVNRFEGVVTQKRNLKHIYSFKNFPVFMGCVKSQAKNDLVADMDWGIDPETGVIQLTKLVPLKILYQEQHVDGCSPTWQKYYKDFARYIKKQKVKSVLEIGGGQGKLAELVIENTPSIKWTIVEPNPTVKNKKIHVVSKFFDSGFKTREKFDTIVFSQLLEHVYSPGNFLKAIHNFLEERGLLIFAYPNLEKWLRNKFTNAINFEHTFFLTDYYLDYLLKKNGFSIVSKKYYGDHSIFYTAKKSDNKNEPALPASKYRLYKKIFLNFINYHKNMIRGLNLKISKSPYPTYLFGAHIFSQFLFAFGLKSKKIRNILDNSPLKQNKRLYGTNLIVKSPQILKGMGKVNVILKAGIYNAEIKKDILENINSSVGFW